MIRKKDVEKNRKKGSREKGQAMLEFAVSLIILLIILSGIIDLGRLFFYYIAMRDAAQEGVVYGIVNPSHCTQITDRTLAILSDDSGVNVSITMNGVGCAAAAVSDACAGNTVVVDVQDPAFPIAMPFLTMFLGRDTLDVHATVSGTILRPPCP